MSSTTVSSSSSALSSPSEIIDVYSSNFIYEIKRISNLLETFPYIGMDTEFPGCVYALNEFTPDFYYKSIKLNVNQLKLIQLGITLCDAKGNFPKGTHTWQFNFKFDFQKDKITPESYSLLQSSGIDFVKIRKDGIPYHMFAEYIMTSGLVLNEDVHWISFHGSYDFAYLLKMLLNSPLPETEEEFIQELELYFPNHYDMKVISQHINDNLNGGLNRIAQCYKVQRIGEVHQAGSDAYVTIGIFNKVKGNEQEVIDTCHNVLFGIGLGADDNETIQYTKFANVQGIVNQYMYGLPFQNVSQGNFQMTVGGPYFFENPMLCISQNNNCANNIKLNQTHCNNSYKVYQMKHI